MVTHDADRGCFVIKFEMRQNGKRIRKTKRLPAGLSYEAAVQIEQKMMLPWDPYHDLRACLRDLKGKPEDLGWIYACVSGNGPVKIGMTRRVVHERVKAFNTSSAEPWRVIGSLRVTNVKATEGVIHSFLADKRLRLNRELFDIAESDVLNLLCAVADEVEHVNPLYKVPFRSTQKFPHP